MNPELQGKCLLKAQKKMLCEKDTTSQLLTLFVKGGSVARDYEVWNRELAGHRFRSKEISSHLMAGSSRMMAPTLPKRVKYGSTICMMRHITSLC